MRVTLEIDQATAIAAGLIPARRRPAAGIASWPPFTVRIPPLMRDELQRQADKNGRSVSAEVMFQLAKAYGFHLGDLARPADESQVTKVSGGSHAG